MAGDSDVLLTPIAFYAALAVSFWVHFKMRDLIYKARSCSERYGQKYPFFTGYIDTVKPETHVAEGGHAWGVLGGCRCPSWFLVLGPSHQRRPTHKSDQLRKPWSCYWQLENNHQPCTTCSHEKATFWTTWGKTFFPSESGKGQLLDPAKLCWIHWKGVGFGHPLLCQDTPSASWRASANTLYCSPPGKFPVARSDFLSTGTAIHFLMLSTCQENVKFVQGASVRLWWAVCWSPPHARFPPVVPRSSPFPALSWIAATAKLHFIFLQHKPLVGTFCSSASSSWVSPRHLRRDAGDGVRRQ